ncbi:hypothetical protein D3C85_1716530 [compost metagenome]
MVLPSSADEGYNALILEQLANGRLDSVLSKQFYGVHAYQTLPGSGCFIFDPVSVQAATNLQHSLSSGQ